MSRSSRTLLPPVVMTLVLALDMSRLIAAPLFQNQQVITGNSTSWAVVGDFNRDGRLDQIVGTADLNMYFLAGRGDGSFADGVLLGPKASGAAVGDFNGDGSLDLSTSGVILFGRGDGTFQAPLSLPAALGSVGLTVAGDLNGDGVTDLVVTNSGGTGGVSAVIAHPGAPFTVQPLTGLGFLQIALGDVNHDGKLDFVGARTVSSSAQVWSMLGQGDGTFTPAALVANGSGYPFSLAVGD